MQENNFEKNSNETPKSHTSPQESVKDAQNSKRKKKLIIISFVLAIFVAAFFLFILPALANAYEANYSRSIVIKQAGGSGADGKWVVIVDRDSTSTSPQSAKAKKGQVIEEGKFRDYKTLLFNDRDGNFHSWKGPLTGHQSVRTDGTAFTESLDCVGVTPHIKIKAPTRKGYDFTGWKVSFTNGQLSTGGAPVTFSTPVSYILKSSHTAPESVGEGIYSYYKDGYYYISAGCYAPGTGGYYDKNMVITALWTPHKYKISYTLNNGAYGAKHPTSATYGKEITISNPTRRGYSFGGWTITGYDNTTAIVFDERYTGLKTY